MRRNHRTPFSSLALLLVAVAVPPAFPAEPELIADLETVPSPLGVEPEIAGHHGDHVYFTAVDPTRGRALWRTDGTEAGTEPFFDLCPGPCGLRILGFTSLGDRFLFLTEEPETAFRPDHGRRLWASDGTREGTAPILQVVGFRDRLVTAGDRAFFVHHDQEHGSEIWSTDGTAAGTRLHDDVCPGPCSSIPDLLTPFGDRLAFQALTPDEGPELWISESEPGEAEILLDTCPGECGAVKHIGVHGGLLYFGGVDGHQFGDVWVSDGTTTGTRLLIDTPQGTVASGLEGSFELGGVVYLLRSVRPKLWRTDGTVAGTGPASEIFDSLPGWIVLSYSQPTPGGRVYLQAVSPTPGFHLLRYDSNTGEVRVLTSDLEPTSLRGGDSGLVGESLVFAAEDRSGDALWVSDGTAAGTRRLDRTTALGFETASPADFTRLGDLQVFAAGLASRRQLWASDGTLAGTRLLPLATAPSSSPNDLTPFAGSLAFLAGPEGEPRGLFRTTAGGSAAVAVAGAGTPADLTAATTGLYYADLDDERRPAVVPASGAPPVRLADVPGVHRFAALPDGRVFFEHWGEGEKLWVSDGSPAGTRLVADLNPDWVDECVIFACEPRFEDEFDNFPDQLTPAGDTLYFRAAGPVGGDRTAWRTDGTAEGTRVIPGTGGLDDLAPFGGGAVATFQHGLTSGARWIDPSGASHLLAEYPDTEIGPAIPAAGVTYYVTQTWSAGVRVRLTLYATGGTEESTRALSELGGARHLEDIREAVAVGERLFLTVDAPGLGPELWTSDGTAAGTRLVADLWPGTNGSNPSSLTPVGSLLLFGADDGEAGHEPWVTDGTAAGTFPVADLRTGPEPSGPSGFSRVGDRIYFAADDGETGRELWALDLAALAGEDPAEVPDDAVGIVAPEYPGFRFWVRITAGGQVQPARRELLCLPETVCVSGALPGRSELFLRIVGPRPNGFLWPILVRFTTSRVEVWIEQVSTGALQHYVLDAAVPGSDELDGLFDRRGFRVD